MPQLTGRKFDSGGGFMRWAELGMEGVQGEEGAKNRALSRYFGGCLAVGEPGRSESGHLPHGCVGIGRFSMQLEHRNARPHCQHWHGTASDSARSWPVGAESALVSGTAAVLTDIPELIWHKFLIFKRSCIYNHHIVAIHYCLLYFYSKLFLIFSSQT